MDKIPVRVRVHTRQRLEDGTAQTFTSCAKGYLYQKAESLYITYDETDEEDRSRTHTTWKIESRQATLIRRGTSSLRLFFRIGSSDSTTLVMPHGKLPVEVQVYQLDNRITGSGGTLRVGYQMNIAGSKSRMDLELQVKI